MHTFWQSLSLSLSLSLVWNQHPTSSSCSWQEHSHVCRHVLVDPLRWDFETEVNVDGTKAAAAVHHLRQFPFETFNDSNQKPTQLINFKPLCRVTQRAEPHVNVMRTSVTPSLYKYTILSSVNGRHVTQAIYKLTWVIQRNAFVDWCSEHTNTPQRFSTHIEPFTKSQYLNIKTPGAVDLMKRTSRSTDL